MKRMQRIRVLFPLLIVFLANQPLLAQDPTQYPAEDGTEQTLPESSELTEEEHGEEHQGNLYPLLFVFLALVVGAGTRHFLKKSVLPYTVSLLLIGLAAGIADRLGWFGTWDLGVLSLDMNFLHESLDWAANINPHLILFIFLPTLVYEAASGMDVHTFRKSVTNATLLAVPGIILALLLTAAVLMGMKAAGMGFQSWGWAMALLFGTVISATDPVAVVAILKELGASKKLGTLIEGESMLNDGTAIVIFSVLLLSVTGGESSLGPVLEFLRVALGGAMVGVLIGWITIRGLGRVFNDAMIEISLVVAAAYLTFFVAEHFLHVSGVLGLVALGLMMAGIGKTRISPEVTHFLHEFWELAAFIANTLIFIIVGVVIAHNATFTGMDLLRLLVIYIGIHLVRALVILLLYPFMRRAGYGLPKKDAVVLWYGALRGAVGLALALMVAGEAGIEQAIREDFLFYTAGIVTLTLLVNATTIKSLVSALGLTKVAPAKALMIGRARIQLYRSAEKSITELKKDRYIKRANWTKVREYLPEEPPPEEMKESILDSQVAETRRRVLEREEGTYWELFNKGLLGSSGIRHLTEAIHVILDEKGLVSISNRKDLEQVWKTPKFLQKLSTMRLVGKPARRLLFERLSSSYESAAAFVYAQDRSLELLEEISEQSGDRDGAADKDSLEQIETEIYENRIQGITFLRLLKNYFPEIYTACSTRQASRVVLNHERNETWQMRDKGLIGKDEADRITEGIEERMKILMQSQPSYTLPGSQEMLREVEWLRDLGEEVLDRIVEAAKTRVYAVGDTLLHEKRPVEGISILLRGKAKIVTGETVVDVIGVGEVTGEAAFLSGIPQPDTVIAVTPLTALWIKASRLESILRDAPELENRLWKFAGVRIAYNLLVDAKPFSQWEQKRFKKWLSEGSIEKPDTNKEMDLSNRTGILVAGRARSATGDRHLKAPAKLNKEKYIYTEGSRIFLGTDE